MKLLFWWEYFKSSYAYLLSETLISNKSSQAETKETDAQILSERLRNPSSKRNHNMVRTTFK